MSGVWKEGNEKPSAEIKMLDQNQEILVTGLT